MLLKVNADLSMATCYSSWEAVLTGLHAAIPVSACERVCKVHSTHAFSLPDLSPTWLMSSNAQSQAGAAQCREKHAAWLAAFGRVCMLAVPGPE